MKVLYNPLDEDFSVEWDKSGPDHKTITIKAGDIAKFSQAEAKHLEKHLLDKLVNDNPPANHNYEMQREYFRNIVEVKI